MKIIGLIPARGGSKGVPRKNIKKLGGKELVRQTIETALQANSIYYLMVSTDDKTIAEVSLNAGANVPFLRPSVLAQDRSPTIHTVLHAIHFLEAQGIFFDAICLLQPTVPFRNSNEIDDAIQRFITLDADSLISVREVPHQFNPHWVYEPNSNNDFLSLSKTNNQIITRRQDLPKAYYRDGSIYITRKKILLESNSLYGKNIAWFESTSSPNINIDTLDDWKKAEQFIHQNKSVKSE